MLTNRPASAVARRQAPRSRWTGDIAEAMDIAPSRASKHLRVLREVGLVRMREEGRQRMYSLEAGGLRRIHEWTGGFVAFWSGSFERLETYARELREMEGKDGSG